MDQGVNRTFQGEGNAPYPQCKRVTAPLMVT